jgi:2-phosphosulfolactate phosphatase
MPKVEVCFSPELLHLYTIENSIVVVIDILRATSSITYGIENGATGIIPVMTVDDCLKYKDSDYLLAAERNGAVVDGFDFGNSPFSYSSDKVQGKTIVLTTTNGTSAMRSAQERAAQVLIGSFLNLQAICDCLLQQQKDVLLLCAGWKGNFNLEDSLFAGAVASHLQTDFLIADDASVAAIDMYQLAQNDLRGYLRKSSHSHRLVKLDIEEDVLFCLQRNVCKVVPALNGERIERIIF